MKKPGTRDLIPADVVLHQLASAVVFPKPYRGGKTAPGWETHELEHVSIAGLLGKIAWIGPSEQLTHSVQILPETRFINGHGFVAIPGFVDSHTHLVYAGDRSHEFEMRVNGAAYIDILAAGGGILNTVEAVRSIPEDLLFEISADRLWNMIEHGVTTIEIKTGYGLDLPSELKMLRVIDRMRQEFPVNIVPTFMGAHAIPQKFRNKPEHFVKEICTKWIPEVARTKLAVFNDVFTETKAFNLDQSREILEAGLKHGLRPKIHADEITAIGGVDLAVELGAVSADHLLVTGPEGIKKLKGSGVIPTVLPGTSTYLMEAHHANARAMIQGGLPVAVASDHNPGSSQFFSPSMIQSLAMLQLRMTASEALIAGTLHAAHALGLGKRTGSLEIGKDMDIVLIDAPSFRHIGYQVGQNLVHTVLSAGVPIHIRG
jgi:imidazolonepropionase